MELPDDFGALRVYGSTVFPLLVVYPFTGTLLLLDDFPFCAAKSPQEQRIRSVVATNRRS